jgi:hypothetical protein
MLPRYFLYVKIGFRGHSSGLAVLGQENEPALAGGVGGTVSAYSSSAVKA